jgi:hypothetical protein
MGYMMIHDVIYWILLILSLAGLAGGVFLFVWALCHVQNEICYYAGNHRDSDHIRYMKDRARFIDRKIYDDDAKSYIVF